MESNQIRFETTINTLDFLYDQWKSHPKRKGACEDIKSLKSRLSLEREVGIIPLPFKQKKTRVERIEDYIEARPALMAIIIGSLFLAVIFFFSLLEAI